MHIRTPALISALLLTLLAVAPAHAQAEGDTATVTLVVDAPESLVYDHEPFHWEDTVTYTEGMTALDLLDQVVEARGSTYTATWYDLDGDGTEDDAFVDEIHGVETDFSLIFVGMYWALYENGEYASTGAAGTVLEAGDTITFQYEGFPATV